MPSERTSKIAIVVIVHDPQPLPLVRHFQGLDTPWIWQCHVDLSSPNPSAWQYLRTFIGRYRCRGVSACRNMQSRWLCSAACFIPPAIDPFSEEESRTVGRGNPRVPDPLRNINGSPLVTQDVLIKRPMERSSWRDRGVSARWGKRVDLYARPGRQQRAR